MPVSVDDGILMALRNAGSTDAQIADAKLILGPLCHMSGANCLLGETGEPLDSETSMKWLRTNKPHLLPVNTADSDAAFVGVGNKTIAARLIKGMGREAADRLAQTYGKKHALDNTPGIAPQRKDNRTPDERKNNPWSREGWNVTRQGSIVKSLGIEKANALAKAAGSHVGAVRPAA